MADYSKKRIYTLAAIAALFLIFAYSSSYATIMGCDEFKGKGTAADPLLVEKPCHLWSLGFFGVNRVFHYRQTTNIDLSTVPNSISVVIDEVSFRPIGAIYEPKFPIKTTTPRRIGTDFFIGSYDGGGYKITNLGIARPDEDYVGLFAKASGNIRNVEIVGAKVVGRNYVGVLIGESANSIEESSVAGGDVRAANTQIGIAGGLVGVLNGGSVSNSYVMKTTATAAVVGGLAGRATNKSAITSSYATGTINSTIAAGALVGESDDTASLFASYAQETTGANLIGRGSGSTQNSGLRSLAQLQCPQTPGVECQGATTYQGWNTQLWSLGSSTQLPVLNEFDTTIMAPTVAPPRWASSARLGLSWSVAMSLREYNYAIGFPNLSSADSIASAAAQSTSYNLQGDALRAIRDASEGGETIEYAVATVRRSGDMASIGKATSGTFTLLDVPAAPLSMPTVEAGTTTARITISRTNNDGYGRASSDQEFGGAVHDIAGLELGYVGQIYYLNAEGNYTNDNLVGGSNPEPITIGDSSVRVSVSRLLPNFPYAAIPAAANVVGLSGPGTPTSFVTLPKEGAAPVVLGSSEMRPQSDDMAVTLPANRGATTGTVTLRARSGDGTTLTWSVVSSLRVTGATVDIGANTSSGVGESEVDVTYSVSAMGGIAEVDFFTVEVKAATSGGTDRVTVDVKVLTAPTIAGLEQRTLQIYQFRAMSVPLVLVARDEDTSPSDLTWFVNATTPTNDEVALVGGATVKITITPSAAQSIATVVFLHAPGTNSENRFTVEVRDRAEGTALYREYSVDVTVKTELSSTPMIIGGDDQTLNIAAGQTIGTINLMAMDKDIVNGDTLTWTLEKLNVNPDSEVAFLSGSGTVDMVSGADAVTVQFTRLLSSGNSTGTFVVRVADGAGLSDTANVIISPPVEGLRLRMFLGGAIR